MVDWEAVCSVDRCEIAPAGQRQENNDREPTAGDPLEILSIVALFLWAMCKDVLRSVRDFELQLANCLRV